MRAAALLAPLALVAAAAPRSDKALDAKTQASLDKALAGLVPGKSQSCIPITYSQLGTRAYGNVLLYSQPGGDVFRNDTAGGCEGAAHGDVLVSVEYQGRPCSGDIIRTVDPQSRMTTGSCALRDFTPYRRPAR